MNTIPLGTTVTVQMRDGPHTGILVRRDARNPSLAPMLTVTITPLGDPSFSRSLQFAASDDTDIVALPTPPGTHVVLSTDLPVPRVYYVGDSEDDVRLWLEAGRRIWFKSGDYAVVAADDPILLA